MAKKVSSKKKASKSVVERIWELAIKPSTFILLDADANSALKEIDSCFRYSANSKLLEINIELLAQHDMPFLHKFLRHFFDEGETSLKSTKTKVLEAYQDYQKSIAQRDKVILDFFKPIIDENDYSALKMSLFLRAQDEQGRDITVYKRNIRDSYGDRGSNIANLCSAGYFDEEFRILYNRVSPAVFYEYYEVAVAEKARALFVNRHMDVASLTTEFEVMVAKAKKYHLAEFRIHGKGRGNVETINQFVAGHEITDGEYLIRKGYDNPDVPAIEFVVELMNM